MEKVFIKKVLVGFYNNLVKPYLECLFNMLINEHIDLLATTLVVTNLDKKMVVIKMNACPLHCVISKDVEDLSIGYCPTIMKLFADLANKNGSSGGRPSNRELLLCKAIEFYIIHKGSSISTLTILAN